LHDEILNSNDMLKKRISLAQRSQFNYILVVGSTEEENETVNVRTRDGEVLGEMKVEEFIDFVRNEMQGDQNEKVLD
jgi:threonyl-tRNA synthetase